MEPIRNSAKAIILRDHTILVIEKTDEDGPWYLLPGGGQLPGETLHSALIRECGEEIGTTISIGALRFIREYIGKNHEFAATDADTHQIEFMFLGTVNQSYSPMSGPSPDKGQLRVLWLPLEDLMQYRLYPLSLRPLLMDLNEGDGSVYLGDVN